MATTSHAEDPALTIPTSGSTIPQLAFGCYKIPNDETGESIILDAIKAGYRHFDGASYYGNERTLGNALKKSGIPRNEFFVTSKVWNDAQKEGRAAVRQSVLQSLELLGLEYLDLFLIHWPVPECFVETYKELELLHREGKLKHLGISNFSPSEYEELMSKENNITIPPVVNQFEVSPFMYRPKDVGYFQERAVLVCSGKSLHRAGECLNNQQLVEIAKQHSVTPAQVMLRWGLNKGLVVLCKTATPKRMVENRDLFGFSLNEGEMAVLDGFTTEEDVMKRELLEKERKLQM
mmetsp:Transcript_22072/g.46564  ORF Transcript_22072/g.46564 Transcript_22072/m.46564 type:complete len:292 (+) Transcript_22072:171-1046(+)|eukprot:CAMPEP_0183743902 /NCGR_PEP_ID=MMETSP0737-20130205/65456_1 /TAXON_ID=385413 /ORGANISM="Thalassiosira miniscula, Strain CCMP1093" /LENGTH=291 /DNA_ID=CAMNT_0025979531 /DNA_START=46 /DNA_END=921 /DNA_ORIENTATION=+